ncbi:MAG: diacylglycerol kinase family protein [Candidatus Limnocylindria bacterium]
MPGLARSFRYAFSGLAYMLRTQRNFRIESGIGLAAIVLAALMDFAAFEWAILATVIALVLILEGLNTSVELAVDLASPSVHPKARAAKDVAAGMVLIASLGSVAVGVFLFGPRLLALLD